MEVVPRLLISGDGAQEGSQDNLMQGLLAMLLSERLGSPAGGEMGRGPVRPEVEAMRQQIYQSLRAAMQDGAAGQTPTPKE